MDVNIIVMPHGRRDLTLRKGYGERRENDNIISRLAAALPRVNRIIPHAKDKWEENVSPTYGSRRENGKFRTRRSLFSMSSREPTPRAIKEERKEMKEKRGRKKESVGMKSPA